MKWMRGLMACVWMASLWMACLSAWAAQVVDDRGQALALDTPPQRVVSLLPSLTESVCQLGACARLVGVDRYSNWPDAVRHLPTVGGGIDPNVEAIVALKPDLVLLAKSSRVVQRLEALGVRVLVLEPRNHADVQRVLNVLGEALAVPGAAPLWQAIETEMAEAARAVPPDARGLRVYFEVNSAPFAAGESSFIGETLKRLGLVNIVPASMGPFPRLNPEFVVRADPQLIMVGERSGQNLERRPGWDQIRAVRSARVCRFDAAESDVLVRPGPRMGEAARLMLRCLGPRP